MDLTQETLLDSAWRGTRWLTRIGRHYGLHEAANTIMHIALCQGIYTASSHLDELRREACLWLSRTTASGLLSGTRWPNTIERSTALIAAKWLTEFGDPRGGRQLTLACDLERRYRRTVDRVTRLETASEYWTIAHALAINGVRPDTEPLLRVEVHLPRISKLRNLGSGVAVAAFNYCTHRLLYETAFLHEPRRTLARLRCAEWLMDFWVRTPMREDLEYASQFLNCAGACGMVVRREDAVAALARLVENQSRFGCWRGANRYDRFHATWCATDALHLHSRVVEVPSTGSTGESWAWAGQSA